MPTHLTEVASIPTSGARAVEPFDLGDRHILAVPQLAYDVPGTDANMNGGDSDTVTLLLERKGAGYVPWQTVPAPGGEDAEFFRIGDRAFLAIASIRRGSGPYQFTIDSQVFEWNGRTFESFQKFEGFAAKQWKHFEIDGQHFLALAQGVTVPGHEDENRPSVIYRWDGSSFTHFQDIDSKWAYNWHAFAVDGHQFLAHADHVQASVLYRWTGQRFQAYQNLAADHGRAFAHFERDGVTYLLVARLLGESQVMRWDGERFVTHQLLEQPGTREFAVVHDGDALFVVCVNFILGPQTSPTTALNSQLYQWRENRLEVVEEFATTGGTDAAVVHDDQGILIAVSNALSPDARFAARTVLYRFTH
ncbi:hypothetical protein [Streptomyces sp. NPDC088794]|uniref:hypothetical protein n=1 Tax=Streptomyces sp. NPDC088794 TaxID=3365902 RepID=UPI0037F68FC2